LQSIINVKVAKSPLALELEKELNMKWDLVQNFPFDAGFDLRACVKQSTTLAAKSWLPVPTGMFFELADPYWELQVRPRSGLAYKEGVSVLNSPGTVDFAYRKEILVILWNLSDKDYIITPGERIAQACFRPIPLVNIEYVAEVSPTVLPEQASWEDIVKKQNRVTALADTGLTEQHLQRLTNPRDGFGSSGKV